MTWESFQTFMSKTGQMVLQFAQPFRGSAIIGVVVIVLLLIATAGAPLFASILAIAGLAATLHYTFVLAERVDSMEIAMDRMVENGSENSSDCGEGGDGGDGPPRMHPPILPGPILEQLQPDSPLMRDLTAVSPAVEETLAGENTA